jgi:hypothetical protein
MQLIFEIEMQRLVDKRHKGPFDVKKEVLSRRQTTRKYVRELIFSK